MQWSRVPAHDIGELALKKEPSSPLETALEASLALDPQKSPPPSHETAAPLGPTAAPWALDSRHRSPS